MYNRVYSFTNENVGSYKELYDFKDASVLSVLASSDQYFMSILNGAKDVTLFDNNYTTYLYFELKFRAIQNLSYDKFKLLFIDKDYSNKEIFIQLYPLLSKECKKYYTELYNNSCLDLYFINSQMSNKTFNKLREDNIIPYFLMKDYYRLQRLLNKLDLPDFYNSDILDLCNLNKSFDIALLSNIYAYLNISSYDYLKFLNKLDAKVIQANYYWCLPNNINKNYVIDSNREYNMDNEIDYFKSNGLILDKVKGITFPDNYVLTLRK